MALLSLTLFAAANGAAGAELPRSGNTLVIGSGALVKACADHAKLAADGRMYPAFAVSTCSEALQVDARTPHDLAATYNNRGVVQLTMMELPAEARADFDAAARALPSLAESYGNRGAALIREERWTEALAEIDRALAMGLKEPWRAYFNRALAKEALGDVRGAYGDYRRASELQPQWDLPKTQLARFSVTSRP